MWRSHNHWNPQRRTLARAIFPDSSEKQVTEKGQIPKVSISICGQVVSTLIDSGCELSCVSEQFFEKVLLPNGVPVLPVSGVNVVGAMGERSCRVHHQVLIKFELNDHAMETICLVVRNLVHPIIFGSNWLTEINGIINFSYGSFTFSKSKQLVTVEFLECIGKEEKQGEQEPEDESFKVIGNIQLSKEEREDNQIINKDQQVELGNLMTELGEVFSEKPGLATVYEHAINVTDKSPYFVKQYPIPFAHRPEYSYISLLRPPITDSTAPGAELIDKVEWKQVFDILWSDPQPGDGCIPNGLRGAGTYFGPDVTKRFLKRNKMLYLIRSHECKPEGYEINHNNKVITVFSASNYYELGSNKGAYLKLVGPQLDTHFVQYTAATGKTKRLTFRQRIGLVESSAIRELRGHIMSNRERLQQEFQKADPDLTGFIPVSEWCKSMETATELGLPWRMLREKLVALEADTQMVNYSTTFDKINDSDITTVQGASTVVELIVGNTNSGFISLEEFSDACNLIREHMPNPISHDQLLDMCRLMDMNKDGLVDLNEFLETFRMVDPEQQGGEFRTFSTELSKVNVKTSPNHLSDKKEGNGLVQNEVCASPSLKDDLHSSLFGSPVHNVVENNIDSPLLSSPKASNVTVTITNTSPPSSPNSSSNIINTLGKSPVLSNRLARK
ncbi:uncharacterized protein LOC116169122 [Photinus pyralis]|uniref:uncharacterized protein LOC116169122 n=1 Tax=Photinus pyralis TaxID=7054 RepID=UPI0012673EE3|nr:uncharacterized protein LOC116169122 [Photinus pyralis]